MSDITGDFDPTATDAPTPAEQPASTESASQDSAPSSPTSASSTESPSPSETTTPWAKSLETRFTDEGLRGQVDAYLREEIQPYITQREQQLGVAGQIWEGLTNEENSLGTYLGLAEQLYGPEVAQAIINSLQPMFGDDPEQDTGVEQEPGEDLEQWLSEQPGAVQQIIRERIEQQEDAVYDQQLQRLAQHDPTVLAQDGALFSSIAAGCDTMEEAHRQWQASGLPQAIQANPEAFGMGTPSAPETPNPDPAPEAPTVLGAGAAAGGAQVGQAVQGGMSIDQAVDDFFATLHGQSSEL